MFLRTALFVFVHVAIVGVAASLWTDNREPTALLLAAR